jgi:predicted dehydrogenase
LRVESRNEPKLAGAGFSAARAARKSKIEIPKSKIENPPMPRPRRSLAWGILGTGKIAKKLAAAIKDSSTGHLAAVGSRTIESARAFANDFGVPRAFGSYEEVLASKEVEAIYISLPNHLHAEWTMRCAAAGKHILCEKPFAVNRAQAERAIEAVRKAKVFLMEAFMYRCHPQTARLVALIREGGIGEVRLIQAGFTYNMGLNLENIRLSNPSAGGAIMDVGCYTISMARLIAGAAGGNPFLNPVEIRGTSHIGERSRVDQQSTAAAKFPGGLVANLSCATQVASEHTLRIWGSEGHIIVPAPWFAPDKNARILIQRRGETAPTEILVDSPAPLYTQQVDTVAAAIAGGDCEARPPAMTWADPLGNMSALDAWRASVDLSFDCERG